MEQEQKEMKRKRKKQELRRVESEVGAIRLVGAATMRERHGDWRG